MKLFLSICLLGLMTACQAQDTLPTQTIKLSTEQGVVEIHAEIADEAFERRKGLMYREEVPEGTGMLFIWPESKELGMWMKNTPSSLDMLFIQNGEVIYIAPETEPFSEEIISPFQPVNMVLEVPAGFAKRHDIQAGARLYYEE